MRVYILTCCQQPEQLYGNLLVFKTLRTGFPTAEVFVADNASIPQARELIAEQAKACGATYVQIKQRVRHDYYLRVALTKQPAGTAAFVDPDICFWENVEHWRFDALLAGRLIPEFQCEYTHCLTRPRLHTSFMWVPDMRLLVEELVTLSKRHVNYEPFRPVVYPGNEQWYRLDTGACEYLALREQVHVFNERELDAYDHLFCGTHAARVVPELSDAARDLFERLHLAVQQDHQALRGAWRAQEAYFRSRQPAQETLS